MTLKLCLQTEIGDDIEQIPFPPPKKWTTKEAQQFVDQEFKNRNYRLATRVYLLWGMNDDDDDDDEMEDGNQDHKESQKGNIDAKSNDEKQVSHLDLDSERLLHFLK